MASQSAHLSATAIKNINIFLNRFTIWREATSLPVYPVTLFYKDWSIQKWHQTQCGRKVKENRKISKKAKLNCASIKNTEHNKSTAVCIIIKCPDETKNNRFRWFDINYICKMDGKPTYGAIQYNVCMSKRLQWELVKLANTLQLSGLLTNVRLLWETEAEAKWRNEYWWIHIDEKKGGTW